jgi:Ca2+-binding EF-hand superfamily protein
LENLKASLKKEPKNWKKALTQEILLQLIENNEDTKVFKHFNTQVGKTFTINEKDESLNAAFQLMLGGYIYFTLLSNLIKHLYQPI